MCYPLFIIRFAFTGIMMYIAWDAYANPYHKDRVQAFTSKVHISTIALLYPLSIWLIAGISRITRMSIDVHTSSHDGGRGISIRKTLSSWHSTRSHSSNCGKIFALHFLFCAFIIWWFQFFCRYLSQSRALAWSGHGTRTSRLLRENWTTNNLLLVDIPI